MQLAVQRQCARIGIVTSVLPVNSGTSFIIGTGAALAKAGPASIFYSYFIVGFVVDMVMCALKETTARNP